MADTMLYRGGVAAMRSLPFRLAPFRFPTLSAIRRGHGTALALITCGLIAAQWMGLPLDGESATAIACALLLVAGLPHGALDIELISGQHARGILPTRTMLAVHLGLAGAMLLLWWVAPVVALVVFLLTADVHFAEDWDGISAPVPMGTAAALLCAPALGHHAALAGLFVDLCGDPDAALVADGMLLLAPVALCMALVCIVRLFILGRRSQAIATAAALTAMVVLPPVAGFAIFFCCHHSPRHLGEAWRTTVRRSSLPGRSLAIAMALTLAGLGIAAALFLLDPRAALSAGAVVAAFTTLSILTVPHMAFPAIAARLAGRAHRHPAIHE